MYWLNHTSGVTVVTPTDRPKSVSNRCVIEMLVAFLCCHVAFWILGVGAFAIGLSQTSSFSHTFIQSIGCIEIDLRFKIWQRYI